MHDFTYAEINQSDNSLRCFGNAPFLPDFSGIGVYCVDITGFDQLPNVGDIYDPETNTFSTPEPPDPYEGYLGDLVITSVDGATLTDGEITATVGQRVTATGRIEKDGQLLPYANMSSLRLPILPTNLEGVPLADAQPSMAVATIAEGIVTASWTPEFTGTYAITEHGLNIRLPIGYRLKFDGLCVFVIPAVEE